MTREREELLSLVRHTEDPTPADEERVRRALAAAIAAGVTSSVIVESSSGTAWFGKALAKLTGTVKLTAAAGGLTAASLTAFYLSQAPAPEPRDIHAPQATAQTERTGAEIGLAPAPDEPLTELNAEETPPQFRPPAEPPSTRARASPRTRGALRAEIDALRRAQAALQMGDGAGALRMLDAYGSTVGALQAERDAARVLALCLLGRVADARTAAEEFMLRHPDSPQRAALASSCTNSKRIEEP